jgi:glutamate synthase domain-containing protein 1
MRDRGPDSAGFAVYGAETKNIKLTVRGEPNGDLAGLADLLNLHVDLHDSHAVLHVPAAEFAVIREKVAALPGITLVGAGRRMTLFKEVGLPEHVAERFGLAQMAGSHGIGHTRMATESAVTTDGAHPYTTGMDQCLVHNGSLSNHNSVRRRLVREGLRFDTENDTEVAAAYLSWRMREGDTLEAALNASLNDLDGFFTFVVATRTGFAVLRDPICCKPAVMAETEGWVAFGSEYRALVDLPGIENARVWEPEPARVYAWEQAA